MHGQKNIKLTHLILRVHICVISHLTKSHWFFSLCEQRAKRFFVRRHILSIKVPTYHLKSCVSCNICSRITRVFYDPKPTVANATPASKVRKSSIYFVIANSRRYRLRHWGVPYRGTLLAPCFLQIDEFV